MKKIMLASAAVFAAALSAQAFAAPPATTDKPPAATHMKTKPTAVAAKSEKGVVDTYTADSRALKLKSGDTFTLDAKITKTDYKAGDKVTVHYTEKDGAKLADKVTMAAAKPKPKP